MPSRAASETPEARKHNAGTRNVYALGTASPIIAAVCRGSHSLRLPRAVEIVAPLGAGPSTRPETQ